MKFILKKSKKKFGDFIIKNFHIFYINTKYIFKYKIYLYKYTVILYIIQFLDLIYFKPK